MTQNVKFSISVILERHDDDARARETAGARFFYCEEKGVWQHFWQPLGPQNPAEQHLYAEKKNM